MEVSGMRLKGTFLTKIFLYLGLCKMNWYRHHLVILCINSIFSVLVHIAISYLKITGE